MKITLPELSLVLLIGPSGSGKSTFAHKHFKSTEVLSSDTCRGLVSDDENDQSASKDAFAVIHFIAAKRLAAGKLTVVDATNVHPEDRKPLIALAREYHVFPVGIIFHLPEQLCHTRNQQRTNRDFGPHVVRRQIAQMRRSFSGLRREGFHATYFLTTPQEVEEAEVERQPLWNNRKQEHGPFDIIGDVHGCFEELWSLLEQLGYDIEEVKHTNQHYTVTHPQGRKAIFLGDLVDRGPDSPRVLRLVMDMVALGQALCVPGNHDMKFLKKLQGRDVRIAHGLAETLAQMEQKTPAFRTEVERFLDGLVSHYVLDDGKLVVAHAGMKDTMQGRGSRAVRDFALYGETSGETDEFGLPVRYKWAEEYRGRAMVVYGHTPVHEPEWLNHTLNIDTGCVFGGQLTTLRYPEKELISVPAKQTYCEPARPLTVTEEQRPQLSAQQQHDELLDIEDVTGKRLIATRLYRTVMIHEENAIAALEVMSRFAVDPKWLIYLPPTMSPCETSKEPGLLEHPAEAFEYYRREGITQVICEEKHMGSRAVVIVCRDEDAARRRFGVIGEGIGICYTRTGRRFFDDAALEAELLNRVRDACERTGLWERFSTDWLCLDAELMPWSVKAQSLLLQQYGAVGAASRAAYDGAVAALTLASAQSADAQALLETYRKEQQLAHHYVAAYRRYCWPVQSIDDLKLAPFHLLATDGAVHADKPHSWHMEQLSELCRADEPLLLATTCKVVDLNDDDSVAEGLVWWQLLTQRGSEGMVVKPNDFIVHGKQGLIQPAVKCRGPEYLRIIYGPIYDLPENLARLRQRGLSRKRSLALREFALGIESIERFVAGEPLRRVHECVFGVLALESEPVDPRL
jgi:protein phosphatase